MIPSVTDRLIGAYPALPTPFHDDLSLDLDGLGEIIDRVLARGILGLTILGSSAEATYLSEEERYQVLGYAAKRVAGRATIVAGIVQYGTSVAVEQGKRFRDLGADALLVALPQYYQTPLAQVITHYSAIVRDVGLPTLYYHYPKPTHLELSPEKVGKLFTAVALVGIKNTSLDTNDVVAQIRAVGRPISMFTGQSFDCLACLRGGAVGSICPVAALMPVTALRLFEEYRAGHEQAAEDAQNRFYQAIPLVMPESGDDGPVGVPHSGTKEALVVVGILKSAKIRDPQPPLSEARRDQIRELAPRIVEL